MTASPSCPDCAHRLACAAGARLACLAAERRGTEPAANRAAEEWAKLKRWNEQARGKK